MFNLAIGIESARARRGASEVNRALTSIRGGARTADRALERTERRLDSLATAGRLVGRTLGVLFAGAGLRSVANAADAYTKLGNQIALVTETSTQAAIIQAELFALADRARAPIEEIGTLYGRAALSAKELGATQGELLQFTEGVAQALAINGSSAQEARGALVQLSQALGSGIVRAEEFNSVLEGARPVLVAVADGMGVTVAQLRQLVIAGEVTSREFFDAFQSQLGNLDSQFQQTNATIGQAGTALNNAFIEAIGTINEFSGASNGIVAIFQSLADFVRGPMVNGFLALSNQIGQLIVDFDNLFTAIGDFARQFAEGTDVSITNTQRFGNAVLSNLQSPFETIRTVIELVTVEAASFFDGLSARWRLFVASVEGNQGAANSAFAELQAVGEARLTSLNNVFLRSEERAKGFADAVKGARETFSAQEIADTLASTPSLGSGVAGAPTEDDDARKAREKLQTQIAGFEAANSSALKFQQTLAEINQLQSDAAAAGLSVNQEAVNAAIQEAVNTYTGYNDLLEEGKSLTESLLTPQEEYNASLAEFTRLLDAGVISEETFNRARDAAKKQLDESNQNFQLLQELGKSAIQDIQGAFTDLFLSTGQGLDDFADQFGQTLQRMAANFLANQAIQFILKGLGSFGGPLGGLATSFAGGFANGGDIPAGQVGLVGERGPEFISGPATITPMQSAMPEISLNVVNVSDPSAAVEAASNTKAGDQGLVNQIGRNADEIRRVLGQA